jgi:hypothetical protein
MNKFAAYAGAFFVLQVRAGLICGIAYAFYTHPLHLGPWVHLLQVLL